MSRWRRQQRRRQRRFRWMKALFHKFEPSCAQRIQCALLRHRALNGTDPGSSIPLSTEERLQAEREALACGAIPFNAQRYREIQLKLAELRHLARCDALGLLSAKFFGVPSSLAVAEACAEEFRRCR